MERKDAWWPAWSCRPRYDIPLESPTVLWSSPTATVPQCRWAMLARDGTLGGKPLAAKAPAKNVAQEHEDDGRYEQEVHGPRLLRRALPWELLPSRVLRHGPAGILGDHMAVRPDDDEAGDAADAVGGAQLVAHAAVEGHRRPGHRAEVLLEGVSIAVARHENHLEVLPLRLHRLVDGLQVRREPATGRAPVCTEVETECFPAQRGCRHLDQLATAHHHHRVAETLHAGSLRTPRFTVPVAARTI
mmetsp:Transcript_43196/g.108227  ORF Transcript_43196/g.108227 Transcript_43196/m.108227 type:complete len:245 (+) Transcript_43196:189-923(+)